MNRENEPKDEKKKKEDAVRRREKLEINKSNKNNITITIDSNKIGK